MPAVTVRSRPNGFPIATTASPTCDRVGVAEREGRERAAVASIWRTARSVDGSVPTNVRLYVVLAGEVDVDFVGAVDDVEVRDDVAVLVDHEAGAERVRRWGPKNGLSETTFEVTWTTRSSFLIDATGDVRARVRAAGLGLGSERRVGCGRRVDDGGGAAFVPDSGSDAESSAATEERRGYESEKGFHGGGYSRHVLNRALSSVNARLSGPNVTG